jgi:hypothetical protein
MGMMAAQTRRGRVSQGGTTTCLHHLRTYLYGMLCCSGRRRRVVVCLRHLSSRLWAEPGWGVVGPAATSSHVKLWD